MNKKEIRNELYSFQDLLGKGRIETALNCLLSLCRKTSELNDIINSIIIFQSTHSHLFNDEVIVGSYQPVEKAKLVKGILEIINKALSIVDASPEKSNTETLYKHIKSVIYDFQKWQSRFVNIHSKEIIENIPIYAQEINDSQEDNPKPAREGIISELRLKIEENQIVLLGQAGMGKSTTLQFIAYTDSLALMSKDDLEISTTLPLPVYMELKLFTETDNLLGLITDKIGLDVADTIDYLNEGKISILLDGLNEIERSLKRKVFNQIRMFIVDYPKVRMIISSRSDYYQREFDDNSTGYIVPVFHLKEMNDSQIFDFLSKNGDKVKALILGEINNNKNLRKIVENPLLLYMLIKVVTKEGNIPSNKSKIIKTFINNIYVRERQEKDVLFDSESIHFILCFIAYETRKIAGSNAGLERSGYLIPLIEQKKKELGLEINIFDFLSKVVELQIMVKHDSKFSFTHEVYQEYFAAEYIIKNAPRLL